MSEREFGWRQFLPGWVRTLPGDLAAVVVLTLLVAAVTLLPVVRTTPLRTVVGLPFVLFVPGYAFVAALFPEASSAADDASAEEASTEASDGGTGIDGLERVALSFGTSVAILPLVGLVLNFTPWGIGLVPVVASVGGLTVLFAGVAARRRLALPEDVRFAVPFDEWRNAARSAFSAPETRTDAAVNVLLVLCVVVAMGSVGYAVAVPRQGEAFSELYLLTQTEDGEFVADGYPTEFVRGESKSLIVGIENQEHEPVTYGLVVELQRVSVQNNSTVVEERSTVGRFRTHLEHNETVHRRVSVTPQLTGERLRLAFLLYRGNIPPNPTVDGAYRSTHLWVTVAPRSE